MGFTWSYSRLADYEKCPAAYKWRHIDKLPEEKGTALERGIKIHGQVEQFILHGRELPPDFKRFHGYIDHVRQRPGLVVEEMWAHDRKWVPCAPKSEPAWWRGKLDAYWLEGTTAHVVDWKTGRIYDSNRDQMRMYAGAVFAREPKVTDVVVELVYLDARESRAEDYRRQDHYEAIRTAYNDRVGRLEAEQEWRPLTGPYCRWCSFSKAKGGPCKAR